MEDNARYWADRHAKGTGLVWPTGPAGNIRRLEVPADELDLPTHLARCGVPDHMAAVIVAGPEMNAAVLAVRDWMEKGAGFLLLHGVSGAGKSLAAATIFLAAREELRWAGGGVNRYDSRGCSFMEVTTLSRESYFDADARDLVAHLKRVRLLVLDDLGAELLTPGYLATMDEIVRVRWEDPRARTVLTSNVAAKRDPKTPERPSPFEERYGARIARRIRENGTVVACDGRASERIRIKGGTP